MLTGVEKIVYGPELPPLRETPNPSAIQAYVSDYCFINCADQHVDNRCGWDGVLVCVGTCSSGRFYSVFHSCCYQLYGVPGLILFLRCVVVV